VLDGRNDEAIHDSNMQQQAWHARQRLVIDTVQGRLSYARNPEYSTGLRSVVSAYRSFHWAMQELGREVREAEEAQAKAAKAAQAAPQADPAGDAADALANALAEAQEALNKLNLLRAK
jgi:hypothetical protein